MKAKDDDEATQESDKPVEEPCSFHTHWIDRAGRSTRSRSSRCRGQTRGRSPNDQEPAACWGDAS